jgi:8-oxo-dGTP pyrophosphatase MutT (NUDIX family)
MATEKVCPVVLRRRGESVEILAFRHPIAGFQLVKGTVEPGEGPIDAARRELAEESGITSLSSIEPKGIWESGHKEQFWHFYLCAVEQDLPESWSFFTSDGGGLNFDFFWFRIGDIPGEEWDPVFVRALSYIESSIIYTPEDLLVAPTSGL